MLDCPFVVGLDTIDWLTCSFEVLFDMNAAAISAPNKLHLSTLSVDAISKLLIIWDAWDPLRENDERVLDAKLAAEDAADATDNVEPNDELIELKLGVELGGLAEQIAFNNLSIPSRMRISKSILLFNSSFFKKKINFKF